MIKGDRVVVEVGNRALETVMVKCCAHVFEVEMEREGRKRKERK